MDDRTVATGIDGAAPAIYVAGQALNRNPHLVEPFNASSLTLVVLDAEQHFIRVNIAAGKFSGRTDEDLLSRSTVDLLEAESGPRMAQAPTAAPSHWTPMVTGIGASSGPIGAWPRVGSAA